MRLGEVLQAAGPNKRRKRIGRGHGSGHGGTSGRGAKGGGSRAGWKARLLAEGGAFPHFRRIPKRGFSNVNFATRYSVVNVGDLDAKFQKGAQVTVEALCEAGLVRDQKLPVKILGNGTLSKKLAVSAAKFSATAMQKIQAAGGEAKIIGAAAAE